MAIITLSSREFNQDTGRAKRAARKGPVFITNRGRPAHVLLTIEQYQKITNKRESMIGLLAMPRLPQSSLNLHALETKLHGRLTSDDVSARYLCRLRVAQGGQRQGG